MVLRILPLALLFVTTSITAQVPTRAPARAPTVIDSVATTQTRAGWFGFRHDVLRDSIVVLEVATGSPAERAGLRAGDRITSIDGRVASPRVLNERPANVGDLRRLTVRRGDETLAVAMVAEAPPRRVLMPSRVALTDPDTLASETRQLRGQMALRATRAIRDTAGGFETRLALTDRALRDTLGVGDLADRSGITRAALDSARREAVRMRAPLMIVDGVALMRDTAGGVRALRTDLQETIDRRDATVARLARLPNAISGAEFEELNPGLAEYFYGVSEGVFVLRVAERTPASSGGLRPGDIIQSVNGEEIRTVAELRSAIAASGRTMNLRILRKGTPAALTIESSGSATRPPER